MLIRVQQDFLQVDLPCRVQVSGPASTEHHTAPPGKQDQDRILVSLRLHQLLFVTRQTSPPLDSDDKDSDDWTAPFST